MATSIKLADPIVEILREDAGRENRSVAAQAEFYIQLGRAIARSPHFDRDTVEAALSGEIDIDTLTLEEQEAYFSRFHELIERPTTAQAYWAGRRDRGVGVGELPDGTRVRQLPANRRSTY